ncbi:MAG TPA: hypothetical protein VEC11_16955 [Allosphingosinicella sp.]|nr:hypothetical protein [Allosphingosinicella sp.]
MARLIVLKKGGGGKVAVNTDHVTHVRSASGAFTDIFIGEQQVAVEGTFEEIVARLTTPDPAARPRDETAGEASDRFDRRPDSDFIFGRLDR